MFCCSGMLRAREEAIWVAGLPGEAAGGAEGGTAPRRLAAALAGPPPPGGCAQSPTPHPPPDPRSLPFGHFVWLARPRVPPASVCPRGEGGDVTGGDAPSPARDKSP